MKKSCKDKSPVIGKSRLFTALMPALVCVSMWGCEYLGEEPKLVESGSRKGEGFAMVSDTTALLAVYYYDRYEWSSGADREDCTKMGMRLVDTRGTEHNYWEGLIDSCAGLEIKPLSDSTVLFLGRNGNEWFEYYIWKIKENPVLKRAKWVNGRLPILNSSMRIWKNGRLLFNDHDKFVLLDTSANTIMQIMKEEVGWPDDVEDAQYFGDDLMTLVFISENHCEFGIMRNLTDTVAAHRENSCEGSSLYPRFNRKFIGRNTSIPRDNGWPRYRNDVLIFSTDSNWQISEQPVARYYNELYFAPLNQE